MVRSLNSTQKMDKSRGDRMTPSQLRVLLVYDINALLRIWEARIRLLDILLSRKYLIPYPTNPYN